MTIQRFCYKRMRSISNQLYRITVIVIITALALYLFYEEKEFEGHFGSRFQSQRSVLVDESTLTPPQRHIKKVCRSYNLPTTLEKIEPDKFSHLIVNDKYKMLYCQIPKVATTTWRRLFLILTGKVGTSNPMALSSNDVHHDLDKHLTYLSKLPEGEIRHRLKTYYKFVFVREPFERVLSAFRNKFDHNYDTKNYVQTLFEAPLIRNYRDKKAKFVGDPKKLSFPEFIDYLGDPDPFIPSNEHWEQFYKLCLPCVIDYDYIGKLESIQKDADYILRSKGLDELVKFPSRKEASYDKSKTNTQLKDYFAKIQKSKLHQLWNAYKADFEMFNYTVPKEVKALM